MAAGTRFQPSDRLFVAAALIALVVFFTTRDFLQLGTISFLVYDSHKYLGAADSLFAGSGWTPLYASGKSGDDWLSVVGGVLHVVPGYPWFIVALWSALGAITAKTDSQVPVISYVSAYPVALIVMILIAKILIGLLV